MKGSIKNSKKSFVPKPERYSKTKIRKEKGKNGGRKIPGGREIRRGT